LARVCVGPGRRRTYCGCLFSAGALFDIVVEGGGGSPLLRDIPAGRRPPRSDALATGAELSGHGPRDRRMGRRMRPIRRDVQSTESPCFKVFGGWCGPVSKTKPYFYALIIEEWAGSKDRPTGHRGGPIFEVRGIYAASGHSELRTGPSGDPRSAVAGGGPCRPPLPGGPQDASVRRMLSAPLPATTG
jgi:hypothetical protein